jgi:N-ethylmaleimide reductase
VAAESNSDLLQMPVALGTLRLRNRIIMSPMSRLRADTTLAPPAHVGEYYAQRASAGLIISESIAVAPYGAGYPPIPGIFAPSQIDAWRRVVNTVHEAGGLIAAQLWHVGRARGEDESAGRPPGWAVTDEIKPHELSSADLPAIIDGFVSGANAARSVGFDAVEIHSGNGFLLDRFLRSATNLRRDRNGGPVENRTRLTLEILSAVIRIWGADRVGIRLSPSAIVAGAPDPEGEETFAYFLDRLSNLGLAYVHATRTTTQDHQHGSGIGISLEWVRKNYAGKLIGAGDFTREDGERALAEKTLDAVVYGRLFLANPDLPHRFVRRSPLNTPNPNTFYTPGPEGLIDYPPLGTQ